MQLPLFEPQTDWKLPDLNELPDWDGAKKVCLDVETYDPYLKETGPSVRTGGKLVGIGVGIEGGPKRYLPFDHLGGDNLPRENVLRYVRHNAKKFKGYIVGANLGYDLDWLWDEDIVFPEIAGYKDVLIAEPLIDDNKFSYNLDSTAKTWLGEQKSKDEMLEAARAYGLKKKSELGAYIWKLPGRYVGMYGEGDVDLPLRIIEHQEKEIEKQGIQRIWNIESELMPVLVKMRRRGVAVDEDRLAEVAVRCTNELQTASDTITKETGVAIGPGDAMQKTLLIKALNNTGFKLSESDSIDKAFIAKYSDESSAVEALGNLRKWDTLRKLSIEPVQQHLVNGRIHCSFNQLAAATDDDSDDVKGARFGRLSCEHVNMQQQPARDEIIGPIWRRIYRPDEGALWAANDYSQQEPRMVVHWAEKVAGLKIPGYPMTGAVEAGTRYREDPDTDNHTMMAELAGIDRKPAKQLFLGVIYGMGEPKLCDDLGLPTKIEIIKKGPRKGQKIKVAGPEAKAIINRLHTKLPFLKQMEDLAKSQATEKGYITTLLGRRCRFPVDKDGLNYMWTRKALNRLIQGSAADQTKVAMVECDRAGYDLQLQVHDEICMSVDSVKEAEGMAEIMRTCVDLTVPSKVDVEIGPSWGEAK